MRIGLTNDQWIAFQGDFRGMRIRCRSGALWLTQAGDRHDYLLRAGDAFVIRSMGMIIAEARRPAIIEVNATLFEPEPSGALRKIMWRIRSYCRYAFFPTSLRRIAWYSGRNTDSHTRRCLAARFWNSGDGWHAAKE